MTGFSRPPEPPYYAVVFTSQMETGVEAEYEKTAKDMVALAKKQPGFLGLETARGEDGLGITVSYWDNLESIQAWKENAEHVVAQRQGREKFYKRYSIRVAKVEREFSYKKQ